MDIKTSLVTDMSRNLGIFKFNGEEENQYLNRLLYSAVASWMVKSIDDKYFSENYNKEGVSKAYLTRKISNIVSQYIELFPSFRLYLDGTSESEYAAKLRTYFEKSGYFVPSGFDDFLIKSSRRGVKVNPNLTLLRNSNLNNENRSIGLGFFTYKNMDYKLDSIEDFFYLPNLDAVLWTRNYINNLKWNEASRLNKDIQYFNPRGNKNLSSCWETDFPNSCEITLYRVNNWDYGFAKQIKDNICGLKIPDWLIGVEQNNIENIFNNDVRRFMYGLKAIYDNKAKSIVYKKQDHFILKLCNALPERELIVLNFLGWPYKGILNEFKYIIPIELFDITKYLLNKLSIDIEEIDI